MFLSTSKRQIPIFSKLFFDNFSENKGQNDIFVTKEKKYLQEFITAKCKLCFQSAWLNAMKLDEVVKGYVLEAETHAKFYREADTGIRNYDDY